MKKAGKILLLILCIALAVGMTAAAALTTSAQVCVWTLYVDGEAYTTGIPGVSFSGNTVTLNGFSGKSIAAIPGGFIGDDDAPVLNIVLIGDNTLSGSYFTNTGVSAQYSADAWYGGIYAYTREGGSGKDSIVNISGSGSLSVNYAPFSRSVSKACNYKAICCGDLNINGGAKVKINYMPRGIGKKTDDTYYSVKGVDAYNVSLKSGILDINVGSLSSINNITKVITRSYADVYGIDAYNIYVDNDYGYMSLDLSSNGGSSNKSLCTSACIRYSAKAPMYLINKNGELRSESKEIIFGSGVWQAGVDYKIFAASRNTNINYEAYGPVSYNDITNNSALTEVYLSDVIAAMTFPKIGDKQLNQTSYTKKDSFYFRETSYLCDVETGQSYLSNTWSEYEEKPDEYMYEFDIHALPAPGFWYVPWQSYFIDAYIDQCLDYEPEYSWIQSSGVAVCYRYGEAIFTVQPKPVCCYFTEISAVAEIKYCPDIKYEWFVDIYDSTGKKAKTMSMEYFDEMNYGFTGQNERTMFLGSFEKDETVPECDFTFAEASKFELYCVAGSVSSEAVSEKAEYYPFGHNIVKTAAKAATCTQAGNSEYYKCTACGELFSDPKGENKITLAQTVVSAKGHAPVKVEAKAATCTAAGNEAYYTCKNCKKVFSDS
ncbi:MAG: hypothetical protein MJ177_03305, partial [Clostridia bacterium]|nr:hypothetical protein [Clostridia bacterium]